MSTLEIKEKLTELIRNSDDDELLQEIYQMINNESVPYPLSPEQKLKIATAKSEIKRGLFSSHDEVKNRTAEWLRK